MEEYNNLLEQMNIQHAIIGDVTTSLPDILHDLTKVRLASLASACNLPGRSKMKKQELIQALIEHLTDADHLEAALLITSAMEWQLFESLLRQSVLHNNFIQFEHYSYLMDRGLVFTYFSKGGLYVIIPDEIKNAFTKLDAASFNQKHGSMQLIYEYIQSLSNLYGVIKPAKLLEIYNAQNNVALSEEEFMERFEKLKNRQQSFFMLKGYIVNSYLAPEESPGELEELLIQIKDKPQYVPERNELLKYADEFYFEMTPQLMKLRAYILKEICRDTEMVDDLIDDIQLACTMEATPQDLIFEFERRDLQFQSMEQADIIVALMNDVYNHTRLWIHGGHTPFEMNRLKGNIPLRSANRPLSALNKNQVSVTKIGRNEPCPCGSGFKYKKCCGK